jgi:hypothetical protein
VSMFRDLNLRQVSFLHDDCHLRLDPLARGLAKNSVKFALELILRPLALGSYCTTAPGNLVVNRMDTCFAQNHLHSAGMTRSECEPQILKADFGQRLRLPQRWSHSLLISASHALIVSLLLRSGWPVQRTAGHF